jgi:hypothetical protein
VVRLNREKIRQTFLQELGESFKPTPEADREDQPEELSLDEMSLQESHSLELSIAINNMVHKAEELYKQQLWELGRRFAALIRDLRAPLSPQALTPPVICDAFDTATAALDVEFEIRLVIYKLFDRFVISELADMYAKILRFLDQAGVQVDKVRVAPSASMPRAGTAVPPPAATPQPAPPVPPPGALGGLNGAGPMGGFAPPPAAPAMSVPQLDAHTLQLLEQLGGSRRPVAAGETYGDQHLAADLAAAALGRLVPGWDEPHALAYVQRAGAVGQMFNQILSDPHLPPSVKPQFDQLRFSVIKTALRDVSFFANPAHPVRGLVNELAQLAATARASSLDTLQRIEQLVGQIQNQFDVAATSVRAPTTPQRPIQKTDVEQFLAQQHALAETRRQAIIAKVRRVVAEELQLHTMDRNLPEAARPLLNSGWAPMMAVRLLRHGMDSEEWRSGLDMLARILDTLDPQPPAAADHAARDALFAELQGSFTRISMAEPRIAELLQGFEHALDEVDSARILAEQTAAAAAPFAPADLTAASAAATGDQPAAAAAAPAPAAPEPAKEAAPDAAQLLELLVVPGNWFRVYDHDGGTTRWLKMVAYYPNRDVIAFAEFNGKNTMLLKTALLIEDLVAGRVEPLDASPKTRHLINAFLKERRERA